MDKKEHPGFVVAAGTSIMLMMGVAYVWGVYAEPLMDAFGWTRAQVSLPFSVFLISYTVGMILGGRLQDIYGPRKICTIGAFLFSLGYLLSGFAGNLFMFCLVYGVIGGIGTGFAYVTPMATVVKWYPHRKGLMGGIVVFGFGAGAFILSPVARRIITAYNWQTAFISLGIVFMFLSLAAAQFLKLPSAEVLSDTAKIKSVRKPVMETSPQETLKMPIFWTAWFMWTLVLIVGLGLMAHIVIHARGVGLEKMAAVFVISVIAIFNGAGRIVLGGLSDKIGRLRTFAGACFIMAAVSLLLSTGIKEAWMFYIVGGVFGLCFGTWLVLYPVVTSDLFGTKHLGANYGLLFSSYGIGGFIGPLFYGRIYDSTGSYNTAFIISAIICVIAGAGMLMVRASAKKIAAKST